MGDFFGSKYDSNDDCADTFCPDDLSEVARFDIVVRAMFYKRQVFSKLGYRAAKLNILMMIIVANHCQTIIRIRKVVLFS